MNFSRFKPARLIFALLLSFGIAVIGVVATATVVPQQQLQSASATNPVVSGTYSCNPATGKWDIIWKVRGDTGYPNETATIVDQSRATTPTLVNKTVKNTGTVTGNESVTTTGTYDQEIHVQWTNHAAGNLVYAKGSVTITGTCTSSLSVDLDGAATCSAGTWSVLWTVTISNYGSLSEVDLKVIKHLPAGSLINGVDAQVWLNEWNEHHANHNLPPFPTNGVVTFTQTNIPGSATTATAGVQYDFKGGPSGDPEKTITLNGVCQLQHPVTGNVVQSGTYCAGLTPVGNSVAVTTLDGTTAEGYILDVDGTTWIDNGPVPAGTYDDTIIGTSGYPNTQKIVLTGEDGSTQTFGPWTFQKPKVAADCEVIETDVKMEYREMCYYSVAQDLSFRPVWLIFDNSGSNIAQQFDVSAPYGALSYLVPAGTVKEVRAQDGWQNGVGYQVTAGGKVFDVSLPAFAPCPPPEASASFGVNDNSCTAGQTAKDPVLVNATVTSVTGPKEGPGDEIYTVTATVPALFPAGPDVSSDRTTLTHKVSLEGKKKSNDPLCVVIKVLGNTGVDITSPLTWAGVAIVVGITLMIMSHFGLISFSGMIRRLRRRPVVES